MKIDGLVGQVPPAINPSEYRPALNSDRCYTVDVRLYWAKHLEHRGMKLGALVLLISFCIGEEECYAFTCDRLGIFNAKPSQLVAPKTSPEPNQDQRD